tara:strand:+ start:2668 stop:4089 length:1422 start_codon:yes stop_codon:yes gene_type:complete
MNIAKSIGIITTVIPIAGILIGGITFGINFKTDVQNIKDDVAKQQSINETIPTPFDDSLLWSSIDNINIPDVYDDRVLANRIQRLEIDLAELSVLLDTFESGETFDDSEVRGRIAELEGQLNALASIEVGDNGEVDITPLIVRIASLEGSMETVRTDIRDMKTDIKNNERAASTASNSSSSSRTVENRYDDSDLRSRISAVERQVNAIPTTNSSGTTVQRVENPFDDSSLRSDISALQTAVAVLQATPSSSYDDSEIRDRIDDIQWELENMDIQVVASDTTDTGWLEDLIYQIKDELTWRINELEWAADTTTTSDDMYAEQWMVEDLQYEVMFIQEQVWELQTLVNDSSTSSNNTVNPTPTPSSPTSGRSWEGSWTEPYAIHLNHKDSSTNHTYTGDFWLDGYWNGEPVWTQWGCGVPPWDICHVYKYNYTSWVLQPSEPSDEWLANSYNDNGVWPWEGTWSGDVNFVDVIEN